MRIIFMPDWAVILSFVVLWPLFQVSIAMLGNLVPNEKFNPNSFILRTRAWEKNGNFYRKYLRIHLWKHLLPDGAKTHKSGFRKKHLAGLDEQYLGAFIAETCRAEIFHWLQILPFWVFGLWSPPFVVWIMLIYALSVNLPCIIAQRYNRPRLIDLYSKIGKH